MSKWLSSPNLNVYCTVTLKQALPNDGGTLTYIADCDIKRTAWLLRDRLFKATVGKKRKDRFPFLVFSEGGKDKRYHLHIMTLLPLGMSLVEFQDIFRHKALKLKWVYDEIDVRPIAPATESRVVSYSLKTGLDAFIPEASFIPTPCCYT